MFLHLGGNKVVLKNELIAIFDDCIRLSEATCKFLDIAESKGKTINFSNKGKSSSFIITDNEVYASPISCATLKKRCITFSSNSEIRV